MKRGWAAICDRCGFRFNSSELKKTWDGLIVCKECFEPRHPQEFVRVPYEEIVPPWTRPQGTDVFINACTIEGRSCYAEFAVAGCSIAGNTTFSAEFLYDLTGPHYAPLPDFGSSLYVDVDYWPEDYT